MSEEFAGKRVRALIERATRHHKIDEQNTSNASDGAGGADSVSHERDLLEAMIETATQNEKLRKLNSQLHEQDENKKKRIEEKTKSLLRDKSIDWDR